MATSAPRARQKSSFSGDPAVQMTRAPNALPSWIAVVPMPLAPPCTSRVSPARSWPTWTRLEYTVQVVSGSAAASTTLRPAGTGSTWPAGTATFSAYPPPAISAHTSSPGCQPVTSAPVAAIRPETSIPG